MTDFIGQIPALSQILLYSILIGSAPDLDFYATFRVKVSK